MNVTEMATRHRGGYVTEAATTPKRLRHRGGYVIDVATSPRLLRHRCGRIVSLCDLSRLLFVTGSFLLRCVSSLSQQGYPLPCHVFVASLGCRLVRGCILPRCAVWKSWHSHPRCDFWKHAFWSCSLNIA